MSHYFSRNSIASIFAAIIMVLTLHGTTSAVTVTATSSNWGGYVAQNGIYTGVSGTWVMPELTYSSTLASNATWVGIGGRATHDLIQAGVYEIANSDGATYQAWYEMLPDDSTPVNLSVHPGDSISVAIIETSHNIWNIVITNNTSGQQFEKTVNYSSALSSAEWIQERPLIDGSFSNLSGFTPVTFTGASAIENGQRVSMAQANAQIINLVDIGSNTGLAIPTALNADGTSFTIYRTAAVATPASSIGPIPTPLQSITPPYRLHRTGRPIGWIIPITTLIPGSNNNALIVHFF